MKAQRALLQGIGRLAFEKIELPDEPAENTVLARTECSAISTGTEVAAYIGEPPLRPGPIYPRKVGYCNVARVLAVGAGVASVAPGQRILTHQSHQSAFMCGVSEILAVLPENLPSEPAALAYLANLGLAALQTAHFQAGEKVAVLGLGVIGLATVALGVALGAEVVAIGNDAARLARAQSLGAHAAFLAADPRLREISGPDLIVTTANPWSAWQLACEIARFRTRIAVLGFPGRSEGAPDFNPLAAQHFYHKQLSIFAAGLLEEPGGGGLALRRNLALILRLLAGDRLPLGELITHRVPWHQLGSLYDVAARRDKAFVAGVLHWTSPTT